MKKIALLSSFLLSILFSMNSFANNDELIDISGGLNVTVTKVYGYQLGHDPYYPADGIGTSNYLQTVCQKLGYDDFVWDFAREWVDHAKFVYVDMSTTYWKRKKGSGLIYKYIVCSVYVQ